MSTTAPVRHAHLDTTAVLSLLLCCFLWGLNQVSIKAAMPDVHVLVQLAIRSVVAFVLLLGWMRWRGIRWSFTDGTGWPGLLCGLLFAVEFGLAFVGLQYTTAARGVVFINTSPFIVALVLAAAHQGSVSRRCSSAGCWWRSAPSRWPLAKGPLAAPGKGI